ncbi:MAG: cysteine synthase family protein [Candidatus Calescibacterium sp.]|nr:cysteine synthase family protein [Candidatus Calescibacterium sp.]MCX7734941.1 cysteine synthase family protein [bacterium]MDW8087996.1 cysteine synthase family protein [Candidatus Calescibacterium sp.]
MIDYKTTKTEKVDAELVEIFENAKKYSIISKIGNTPLIKLERIKKYLGIPDNISLWAKLEGFNPGGSVKDRPALCMIEHGIRSGELTRDKIILDSTSGNTGIAYAMIGAVLGIKVVLCIPANASFERLKILTIFGAELKLTNPLEGSDGAIIEAKKMYESNPSKYFKPDQYSNAANPLAHYLTTSLEIWKDTQGKIDFFVGGVGTGGVIMGNGKRLKELNKNIKIIAVEPEEPIHGLEGLRNTNFSFIPPIFDTKFPDSYIRVKTEDAYQMCRLLALKEGLFVGGSAGAVMKATEILIKELLTDGSYPKKDYSIVMLFPDSGDRYFSSRLWEDKKFTEIITKIRWKKD